MPAKYGQEAKEECRRLYLKYGGQNFDAIEREMRKQYPKWNKSTLHDRKGRNGETRDGWITECGFENSLRLHLEKLTEAVNDDEQDLYLGIKAKRKQLQEQCAGKGATKELLWLYRDMCKLEIEARKNLDLTRDNFETFVAGYEKLLMWLGDLDPAAVKHLVKHGEKLTLLAQAHYGKSKEVNDGADIGEDEGRDGSSTGPG